MAYDFQFGAPNPGGENYAFENAGDMAQSFKDESLGNFFKRLFMTPSQAAAQQAGKAPVMGLDQDLDPATQARMLASLKQPPQPTVQDLPMGDMPMPPQAAAAIPPSPAEAAPWRQAAVASVPAVPPVTRPRLGPPSPPPAETGRPMTSLGPALGPFPAGVPHETKGDMSGLLGGANAAISAPKAPPVKAVNRDRGGEMATWRAAPKPLAQPPASASAGGLSSFLDYFSNLFGSSQPSNERQLFEKNFKQSGMGSYGNQQR